MFGILLFNIIGHSILFSRLMMIGKKHPIDHCIISESWKLHELELNLGHVWLGVVLWNGNEWFSFKLFGWRESNCYSYFRGNENASILQNSILTHLTYSNLILIPTQTKCIKECGHSHFYYNPFWFRFQFWSWTKCTLISIGSYWFLTY